MLQVVHIALCSTVWILVLSYASAEGPPIVTSDVNRNVLVQVGDEARLLCPVKANPTPMLSWTKDGESIHQGWDRFRELSRGLKIKHVEVEDSGTYRCRATNGYGSVEIEYVVYVSPDVNSTGGTLPPDALSPDQAGHPPVFSHPEEMHRIMTSASGQSIRLSCRASGHPRPAVIWYYNGELFSDEEGIYTDVNDRMSLRIENTQPRHSGSYMCHVFNHLGRINFTYALDIREPVAVDLDSAELGVASAPEITAVVPRNQTVPFAEQATFQCFVSSDIPPEIKWLKQVDEHMASPKGNGTIRFDGNVYVIVNSEKARLRQDGSYVNKLRLTDVTAQDAGTYVCFSANSAGFTFKSATLTVLAPPLSNEAGLSLYIIIIIAAASVILLVIVIVCITKRSCNNSQKSPSGTQSTIVRSPRHVATSDKHNCDYSSLYSTANTTPSIKNSYHSDGQSGQSDISQKMLPAVQMVPHPGNMNSNMMGQQHMMPQQQMLGQQQHMQHGQPHMMAQQQPHMVPQQHGQPNMMPQQYYMPPPGQVPANIYPQLSITHQHHHIQHYDA